MLLVIHRDLLLKVGAKVGIHKTTRQDDLMTIDTKIVATTVMFLSW